MDNYVKAVIFACILALSAWDILCIGILNQRQPPAPQISYAHAASNASSSFIAQETHLQPVKPSDLPSNPARQPATGSRNYIAPRTGPPGSTPVQNVPVGVSSPPPRPTQNTPSAASSIRPSQRPTNVPVSNQGTRDYINPQFSGQNKPTAVSSIPSNLNIQRNNPTPANNKRDYVNPQLSSGGSLTPKPTQNPPATASSSSSVPRPPNTGVTPTPFSYANAAGSKPKQSTPNTNVRDYVAPQRPGFSKPAFPPLPKSSGSSSTLKPVSTTISYANKVAGGATTKPPATKPGSTGPGSTGPSASSTVKPEDGPTDLELKDFSEALLRRDVNNAAKFVTTNLQGKTTSQSMNDDAPERLLMIKPEAYEIPTIAKIKLLHNNYILESSENEHVTPQEKMEENDLLDAMLSTPVMQYTRNYLVSKNKIEKDPKAFKDLLKLLWFNMYSRGGGRIGSSGFEHIFVAELKKDEVSGMHNWLYFDQAENSNVVDYQGYLKKVDLGEKGTILKFRFKLNGVHKPVDSMFIGTSPELEMALYTTCFMFRADRICPLKLAGNNFIIRTYTYRYRGKNMIGSAFPEI